MVDLTITKERVMTVEIWLPAGDMMEIEVVSFKENLYDYSIFLNNHKDHGTIHSEDANPLNLLEKILNGRNLS